MLYKKKMSRPVVLVSVLIREPRHTKDIRTHTTQIHRHKHTRIRARNMKPTQA